MSKEETFCCIGMRNAIGRGDITQMMWNHERDVVLWVGGDACSISFCPFCGAKLA